MLISYVVIVLEQHKLQRLLTPYIPSGNRFRWRRKAGKLLPCKGKSASFFIFGNTFPEPCCAVNDLRYIVDHHRKDHD
jgi:hypothetical protein